MHRPALSAKDVALEDVLRLASAAIGPNCDAGPDLIRIANRAEAGLTVSQGPASGTVEGRFQ